jgi:hypothetical protein
VPAASIRIAGAPGTVAGGRCGLTNADSKQPDAACEFANREVILAGVTGILPGSDGMCKTIRGNPRDADGRVPDAKVDLASRTGSVENVPVEYADADRKLAARDGRAGAKRV